MFSRAVILQLLRQITLGSCEYMIGRLAYFNMSVIFFLTIAEGTNCYGDFLQIKWWVKERNKA